MLSFYETAQKSLALSAYMVVFFSHGLIPHSKKFVKGLLD